MEASRNIPHLPCILLVEDDPVIADLVIQVLEDSFRCSVFHMMTAEEALSQVEKLAPCLLILDYQLPRENGLHLYDVVQTHSATSAIPVLFMSANLPWSELRKREISGIEKPFELEDLVDVVGRLCGPTLEAI